MVILLCWDQYSILPFIQVQVIPDKVSVSLEGVKEEEADKKDGKLSCCFEVF